MKIVVKRVGQEPEVKEVENELHTLQELVGGYIQCVNLPNNILCVCDEEGKLKNSLPNIVLGADVICGNIFFCSAGEEDFESLNDEQIEFIINIIHIFEIKSKK